MTSSNQAFNVLVIGGGPAGMAAAARAAESGAQVGIVNDNLALGGQIWRGGEHDEHVAEAIPWRERLQRAGVSMLCGMRVFHQPQAGVLLAGKRGSVGTSISEADPGDRGARAILTVSWVDAAQCDGRRWIAGDGQVRVAGSR